MQSDPGRALIIANLSKDDAGEVAREIGHFLRERGHTVDVHAFAGKPDEVPRVAGADFAVSLGGDGKVALIGCLSLLGALIPLAALRRLRKRSRQA